MCSPNQQTFEAPLMNLTMEGGDKYSVKNPFVFVPLEDGGTVFCLGIDKSEDVNIIGRKYSTLLSFSLPCKVTFRKN
ncbi:hypothetical protein Hanom_Chr05g00441931 [Helianthus anomalus]